MPASHAEAVNSHTSALSPSARPVAPLSSPPARGPVAPVPPTASGEKDAGGVAPTGGRKRAVIIAASLAVAGAAGAWYATHRGLESTDDAQIDAEVIAVPSRTTGTVMRVLFAENDAVKEGQLLALLDDAPQKARLAQAEATLAVALAQADAADADARVSTTNAIGSKSVAEASLQSASVGVSGTAEQIREAEAQVRSAEIANSQAKVDRERADLLFSSGASTKAQLDQAETALSLSDANLGVARSRLASMTNNASQAKSRVAEASARLRQSSDVDVVKQQAEAKARAAHAQVETAKASRDLAALELSYTKIFAPHEGVVSKKNIHQGQSVAASQPIVQLVTPGVWITANFKETQVGAMTVGQPVHITVDAFHGREFEGEVESLSGATGSRFTLLPPDNASGNYTKVVQRVPVRIRVREVPAGVALRPGMSAEITVDTRH
jgi:membrane fusion protein (multidrug efflux system)